METTKSGDIVRYEFGKDVVAGQYHGLAGKHATELLVVGLVDRQVIIQTASARFHEETYEGDVQDLKQEADSLSWWCHDNGKDFQITDPLWGISICPLGIPLTEGK